jgi:hypothetical protein
LLSNQRQQVFSAQRGDLFGGLHGVKYRPLEVRPQARPLISYVHNYIFGNNNTVASGTDFVQSVNQRVNVGDIDGLMQYLAKIGLSPIDTKDLRTAIQEDGPRPSKDNFGPKVAGWIGNATKKALEGTWRVGIDVSTALLTKALGRYYGWE